MNQYIVKYVSQLDGKKFDRLTKALTTEAAMQNVLVKYRWHLPMVTDVVKSK